MTDITFNDWMAVLFVVVALLVLWVLPDMENWYD